MYFETCSVSYLYIYLNHTDFFNHIETQYHLNPRHLPVPVHPVVEFMMNLNLNMSSVLHECL